MCVWHKWKIKEKEILPSFLEQMSTGQRVEKVEGHNLAEKLCIVTYQCTKCGAEKVERI